MDRNGRLVRIMRHGWTPVPVDAAAIRAFEQRQLESSVTEAQERRWHQLFREWSYPEVQPAYDRLLVDEAGNVWLRHFRPGKGSTIEWSVMDTGGRWLGTVELPADLDVKEIGTDYILALVTDELGVEHVRLHSIAR